MELRYATGAISTEKNPDGTYTVRYFGKVCGHIAKGKKREDGFGHWIAITIHNDVRRLSSLNSARSYLVGAYH
jgi:hypothetical protein